MLKKPRKYRSKMNYKYFSKIEKPTEDKEKKIK